MTEEAGNDSRNVIGATILVLLSTIVVSRWLGAKWASSQQGSSEGNESAVEAPVEKKKTLESFIADALTPIPSSIMDDKMKEALRDLTKLVVAISNRVDKIGFTPQHPFVVNIALLRLYVIRYKKLHGHIKQYHLDHHQHAEGDAQRCLPQTAVARPTSPSKVKSDEELDCLPTVTTADKALDDIFLSHAMHYLRCAEEVYSVVPMIAEKDVILHELRDTAAGTSAISLPRHVVFLDHVTRTIIVAIRGTASISDVVTDLFIDTKPFLPREAAAEAEAAINKAAEEAEAAAAASKDGAVAAPEEQPPFDGLVAHRGIAQSAELLLDPVLVAIRAARMKRNGAYRDYSVVVTGHSLGAGTACLLGLLIADKAKMPVTVYSFAPPPVLSSTMKECDPHNDISNGGDISHLCKIHNFVLNEDIIPRSSKHEILNMMSLLYVLDKLPWNAAKRTHMILTGEVPDEDLEAVHKAYNECKSPFLAKCDAPLYVPGAVYVLRPAPVPPKKANKEEVATPVAPIAEPKPEPQPLDVPVKPGKKPVVEPIRSQEGSSAGKEVAATSPSGQASNLSGLAGNFTNLSSVTETFNAISTDFQASAAASAEDLKRIAKQQAEALQQAAAATAEDVKASATATANAVSAAMTAATTSAEVDYTKPRYLIRYLPKNSDLFTGFLFTGDGMLADHRSSSYLRGLFDVISPADAESERKCVAPKESNDK